MEEKAPKEKLAKRKSQRFQAQEGANVALLALRCGIHVKDSGGTLDPVGPWQKARRGTGISVPQQQVADSARDLKQPETFRFKPGPADTLIPAF